MPCAASQARAVRLRPPVASSGEKAGCDAAGLHAEQRIRRAGCGDRGQRGVTQAVDAGRGEARGAGRLGQAGTGVSAGGAGQSSVRGRDGAEQARHRA